MSSLLQLSYLLLWALVVFQGLVLLGLVRVVFAEGTVRTGRHKQHRDLQGEEAPAFEAQGLRGEAISNSTFTGSSFVLLFVSAGCQSCASVLEDLEPLKRKAGGPVVIVCSGTAELCATLAERHELDAPVVIDRDGSLTARFAVASVPTAVLVDETGVIRMYGNAMRDGSLLAERLDVSLQGVPA
jgi:peroxiredoxin